MLTCIVLLLCMNMSTSLLIFRMCKENMTIVSIMLFTYWLNRSSPNITKISQWWVGRFWAAKTHYAQRANLYYLQQTRPILIRSTLTLMMENQDAHTMNEREMNEGMKNEFLNFWKKNVPKVTKKLIQSAPIIFIPTTITVLTYHLANPY